MTNEHFENYLREFEPRKPRTLPIELVEKQAGKRFYGLKRLAAAAAIVLICGTSLWKGLRQRANAPVAQARFIVTEGVANTERRKTAFELTKTALEDSARFEDAIERESQSALPKFDYPKSTLRALIRE